MIKNTLRSYLTSQELNEIVLSLFWLSCSLSVFVPEVSESHYYACAIPGRHRNDFMSLSVSHFLCISSAGGGRRLCDCSSDPERAVLTPDWSQFVVNYVLVYRQFQINSSQQSQLLPLLIRSSRWTIRKKKKIPANQDTTFAAFEKRSDGSLLPARWERTDAFTHDTHNLGAEHENTFPFCVNVYRSCVFTRGVLPVTITSSPPLRHSCCLQTHKKLRSRTRSVNHQVIRWR